jgi:hypothetical protein
MPRQEFTVTLKKPEGFDGAFCEAAFNVKQVF